MGITLKYSWWTVYGGRHRNSAPLLLPPLPPGRSTGTRGNAVPKGDFPTLTFPPTPHTFYINDRSGFSNSASALPAGRPTQSTTSGSPATVAGSLLDIRYDWFAPPSAPQPQLFRTSMEHQGTRNCLGDSIFPASGASASYLPFYRSEDEIRHHRGRPDRPPDG